MMSNANHIMTLANSIIGVGILAMPFCFQKCGVVLSVFLLIISNYITRICCHYLIKSSLLTRRKSFELLGFQAFGHSGKLLVELCIIGYLLGTCITYYVVLGDLGPQVFIKMFQIEHLNGLDVFRPLFMLVVTLCCILPLGMLKNVDSLSTVCTASIGFYICLVLKIVLESEQNILTHDWQQEVKLWEPSGILQCLPIFSMSLSCQMQIFEVFGNVHNQSLDKLIGIVQKAIWICTLVYIAVGFFGYVAFCKQNFTGNILLNFSPSFGNDVISMGFILSLAFSFPLVIFPCRASIHSLLYKKEQVDLSSSYIPEVRFKWITILIVFFSLGIALLIPSVEVIIGLIGSTIGVGICVIFPALCFRKIVNKESNERKFAQFIALSGWCLLFFGTYANLSALEMMNTRDVTLEDSKYYQEIPVDMIHPKLIKDKLKDIPKLTTFINPPRNQVDAILTKPLINVIPLPDKKSQFVEIDVQKKALTPPVVTDFQDTKLKLKELKNHLKRLSKKNSSLLEEKLKIDKLETKVEQEDSQNNTNLLKEETDQLNKTKQSQIEVETNSLDLKSNIPLPIIHAKKNLSLEKKQKEESFLDKKIAQSINKVADNQSQVNEKSKDKSELDNLDAIRRDLLQL